MKMKPLGRTGIQVSELCLGTLTFGTMTSEPDSHVQIDYALDNGINFVDTAEMYPGPIQKETIGKTEEIIGNWNAMHPERRDRYILATKHTGEGMPHVRDGAPISAKTIPTVIEDSLRRLKTDYIDLYQFHWPNRGLYMFRKNWDYIPSLNDKNEIISDMEECLQVIQQQVDKGNIRYFGMSNESAWGASQWIRLSEEQNLPRITTIQNEYSLLCRLYDTDLAELGMIEDVGLLAFSPIATGLLTGKYQKDFTPSNSRRELGGELGGRITDRVWPAITAYTGIAAKYGIDPIHMALAWCQTRPFLCSSIIGARTQEQLAHIIKAVDVELSSACLQDIAAAHKSHPMPF